MWQEGWFLPLAFRLLNVTQTGWRWQGWCYFVGLWLSGFCWSCHYGHVQGSGFRKIPTKPWQVALARLEYMKGRLSLCTKKQMKETSHMAEMVFDGHSKNR